MNPSISVENLKKLLTEDEQAFTQFYKEYHAMLYYHALKYMKNHEDAEDIVQEAFTRIYLNIQKFNFSCKISTWMKGIVKNLCIDRFREKSRKSSTSLDVPIGEDNSNLVDTIIDEGKLPEQLVIEKEEHISIINIVEEMPLSYRNVFVLRFFSDYSMKEISNNLSMELNTVKTNIFRSKKFLKGRLLQFLI
ncbi:RNA polymerase sigma-H factor Sigma-30 (plasmid) [Paenibacillus polymyxa M1]|uniref:RNA polymerase sigma factor n=1 Tax=Paenibacillus polymyxa TaxID=1406 RepID=UPI00021BBB45|nr:sigma-70 family RNA polymerase sigma factor [Paenibacillus polymyxa]CCC86239.1 RNA polymerase sigma-H factor Sigma-30 [Paenibacillus polymyxa M1]